MIVSLYGILGNVSEFFKFIDYYDGELPCYQNHSFGCSFEQDYFELEDHSGDTSEGFRCARRLPSSSE